MRRPQDLFGSLFREVEKMELSRKSVSVALSLLALGTCSQSPAFEPPPERHFADGLFTSSKLPSVSIRVDEGFQYVGATTFELAGEAVVDRHHLVDIGPNGRVERILILHFEGFLPESEETYRYRIPSGENATGPDARFTLEPVRLGDHDYIHNTWFFSAQENINANPERELDRSSRLLKDHGYTLPEELRMSRFVRVVDEEAKHEFIIFYLEPLSPTGYRASQFVEGGAGAAVFEKLSAEVTARSLAAFRVEKG